MLERERKTSHYYPFVRTMFYTGMKPSEALALRWGDIDLNRREIMITSLAILTKKQGQRRQEASGQSNSCKN